MGCVNDELRQHISVDGLAAADDVVTLLGGHHQATLAYKL